MAKLRVVHYINQFFANICDEVFLRDTEKMLAEEIAYVFELDTGSAKHYLQNKLKASNLE